MSRQDHEDDEDERLAALAKAIPSAASPPRSPEGKDTTCVICCGDASSLGSWVEVRMGYQHTGSETRYGNRLVCRDCRERIVEALKARWPAPPQAVPGTPSAAVAASAPEGLKPCPFCGSAPVEVVVGSDDDGYDAIECRTCNGGDGVPYIGVHAESPEAAAAIWNQRASP